MKKVALIATLLLLGTTVYAYTSPGKPQGFVNDFANILSIENENLLNQEITNLGLEIAVVTVPNLGDETIETFAVKLFEEWGIGDKEKDNGALFLIAPNERKVRVEVGYGLEGVLTDAQSNGIIQNVVLPEFRANNMEKGILDGTRAIVAVVQSEADYSQVKREPTFHVDWFYLGIIAITFLSSILGMSKSWWLGGVIGGIFGIILGFIYGFLFTGILSIAGLTLLGLLFDYIVSKHGGGRGGFLGGFGGGRSSGGGFGGFSGGSSGGGGSSGSW